MKAFMILSLLVGLMVSCQIKTSSNDISTNPVEIENDTSVYLVKMDSIQKQAKRKFERIKIIYFDMLKQTNSDIFIWNDSICLKKEWFEKNKGKVNKKEIIKNTELIHCLSNYIFFFFVEKNNYIIENPRIQGMMLETDKVKFDIIVDRGIGNSTKKRIIIEPDFIYCDEFMNFLHLLDSF